MALLLLLACRPHCTLLQTDKCRGLPMLMVASLLSPTRTCAEVRERSEMCARKDYLYSSWFYLVLCQCYCLETRREWRLVVTEEQTTFVLAVGDVTSRFVRAVHALASCQAAQFEGSDEDADVM